MCFVHSLSIDVFKEKLSNYIDPPEFLFFSCFVVTLSLFKTVIFFLVVCSISFKSSSLFLSLSQVKRALFSWGGEAGK